MGGPIWSAPIHDQEWVAAILADVKSMKEQYPAYDRICAMLTAVSEVWLIVDFLISISVHNISISVFISWFNLKLMKELLVNLW